MKVMVCYDGSDKSHEALEKAVNYFKALKPEIILLTVTDEVLDASMESEEIFKTLESEQHEVLKKAAEWVAAQGLDVDATRPQHIDGPLHPRH